MPSSSSDNSNRGVGGDDGEDVHSNAWESAKNDRKYQAGHHHQQQHQQQGSGESSSTSTSTPWHQQDEEHEAAGQHQQHWSDDTFDTNVSSMETGAVGTSASAGAGSSRGQTRHDSQRHASSSSLSSSSSSWLRKMISCSCTVLRKLSHPQTLLNLIDWSVIILLVILLLQHHNDDEDNNGGGGYSPTNEVVLEFLSIGLVTILFLRFIVTSNTIACLSERRCSKNLTAHLSLGLCVSYGILGVTSWIVVSKLSIVESPPWCPKKKNKICQEYPGAVPIVLIVLCVVEGMRWVYAQGVLRQYLQDHPDQVSSANTSHRTSQYVPHSPGASSSHRSRNRPWWWNHRNQEYDEDGGLQEPLIHGQPGWTRSGGGTYVVDDGVSTPRRSGGLLGWMTGGITSSSRTGNDNPRDDGSVDYASLSEDWASRSEEDPYWWTQPDN